MMSPNRNDMAHWLDDYPALRVMQKTITASDYNRIRLGLSREKLPWRIELKKFRCLYCVLDETAWVCIDECQDDLPILAWRDFNVSQRDSLESPVTCRLFLFHTHAGLIMGSALEALVEAIEEHFKNREIPRYPVSDLSKNE